MVVRHQALPPSNCPLLTGYVPFPSGYRQESRPVKWYAGYNGRQRHFRGNAQVLKQLEVTESGISPTILVGGLPTVGTSLPPD